MDIYTLTMDDYDAVLALWKVTEGVGVGKADEPQAIRRYLERNPGMSFVARGADGALLGAVLCGHDGRRGYVHHLAVRPECRGQGIGRALIDRCLEALAAEQIDKCHLFVFRNNQVGRAFWEKNGWSERTSLTLYSKDIPLEDTPAGSDIC